MRAAALLLALLPPAAAKATPGAVRALGPPPGAFVPGRFGLTHYTLAGPADAPLLVFSHGLGAACTTFDFVAHAAVDAGFQVLRYDFYDRGWSASGDEFASDGFAHDLAFGTDVYVSQVEDLMRSLELQGKPFVWVGHSTGCAVGLAYCAAQADKVKGMVLMGAAGLPVTKPFTARVADLPVIGNFLTRRLGYQTFRKFVRKAFGPNPELDGKFMPVLERLLTENPKYFASIRSTNKHFPFGGFRGEFEELCARGMPVQLIWGEKDTATPFANCVEMERIAKAQGARVGALTFPDGAHNLHLDARLVDEVRESILEFARSV
uniref:AB hydrolase-1 domain-containing protein n=1 Tax=Phaeomonas parva TaxID=124430 RepID=A0A7S1UAI1_9STRA|mmetsp:Transcript_39173/g.122544  ORF Transcript_39173/g.122544 Transcript_39173/m.122544 type:complete len:321 (+) Transcript_39173:78-1040(+)